jgi:hypothetical protein
MAIAITIATVVVVIVLAVVLARQGTPGRLSDEAGRRPRRADVVERPAGPDAEPMAPGPPERPADTRPPGGTAAWPDEGSQP